MSKRGEVAASMAREDLVALTSQDQEAHPLREPAEAVVLRPLISVNLNRTIDCADRFCEMPYISNPDIFNTVSRGRRRSGGLKRLSASSNARTLEVITHQCICRPKSRGRHNYIIYPGNGSRMRQRNCFK